MGFGSTLRGFLRALWRILDAVRRTLHLLLLLAIFGFLLAALHTSIPIVPRSAALVLAPRGELVEQLSGDPLRRALGEVSGGTVRETLLRDVVDSIEAAKSDPRIKLLVLNLDRLAPSGLSKLQEVGAAIRDFRASGKRVIAAGDSFDQTQYYVAAQAGDVYLDPLGQVDIEGFSYYRMYFKDAIDKLGVDVNIFRAGTFKSYTDQYSRNDMSASEREESAAWLATLWSAYQRDVTRARSLPAGALQDYVQQQPAQLAALHGDAAKLALQHGLVTALKSRSQLADELRKLVGENTDSHSFNSISMDEYLEAVRTKHLFRHKPDARIAVVVAAGEILDGRQPPGTIGGESTSALLRQAQTDPAVKAVVLRIDSPGGSMFAAEQILRTVHRLRRAGKPVVVSMSSYAASGGYYIATGANQIFASPTTLTGSIGVFAVLPTFQRTLQKLGVSVDGLGTTPLAGMLSFGKALTADEKQLLQSSVDFAYQQFLQRVADGRKKSVADVDAIAQGRVWSGVDAQRLGLVDHLGDLQDAIAAAAKLADLPGKYGVDYIEPELGLREELLMHLRANVLDWGRLAGLIPSATPFGRVLAPIIEQARELARFNDPRGVYAYCWCALPGG
ncbi:MAG TPA: signal peptide peptidase SppA [Steroidobacteraceae bacterium]|nr:signal peptide peptidase SppA [Steroidobacteraceae bacterium]